MVGSFLRDVPLSENFVLGEFSCGGFFEGAPCCCNGAVNVSSELIELLQEVRTGVWSRPLRVLSGYRCETYNRHVGGHSRSYHMFGMAADVRATEIAGKGEDRSGDYERLAGEIVGVMGGLLLDYENYGRVICYPDRGFIHIDVGRLMPDTERIRSKYTDW